MADILLRTVAGGLLQHLAENGEASDGFFDNLHQSEQARFFRAIVDLLSNDYVGDSQEPSVRVVSGAAGVIHRMVGKTPERRSFLADWVTNVTSSPAGFRHGVGIRRAVIAVLAQDSVALTDVLEKTLGQFGDQWNVRHMADSAQEALAQVVLLSAGYVHRKSPRKLATILRGSVWLNAMSNRMRSSESRTRILGMVVGEALSGLVDKPETRLDFKMEETSSDEARWLKGLVGISDSIGPYKDMLRPKQGPSDVTRTSEPKRTESKQAKPAARSQPSTARPIVEELSDGEGESSDAAADPKPYAKPLHDPEDSDDDPTLVRRDRPKPPVYIRDLIAYLRDTENYDKQKLALTHAPVLIRRKATFGSEVSSHAEELAGLLVGVQDKFDMEGFHDMRQQAMLALLVGLPAQMGPWFAKTFFDGDYSLGQRASILVVLGLAARELAGFDVSPYRDQASFPSQLLPKRVEKLYLDDASARESQLSSNPLLLAANSPYIGPSKKPGAALKALPANAIDHMAADLASSFLAPVAAAAADELAGPNALKLATASSRVASRQQGAGVTTRKASPKPKAGVVTRANTTASLLATSFFFPLASRLPFLSSAGTMSFSIDRSADSTSSALLLPLLIKTLALTLHAAGPASAPGGHLREMTRALWGFVLTLRGRAVAEEGGRGGPLLRAMIVSLATLLEVNEAASSGLRRLCEEHPRDVVETAEWLSVVMEGLADGGGEGESPNTRALVAAVLLKLRGMLEEFRLLLVGDLIGYG